MNLILGAKEYLFIGLGVVVLVMFGVKEYQISELEREVVVRDLEIEKYRTSVAYLEGSLGDCNASLSRQNEEIAKNAAAIEDKERKLKELKAHPPDVRYKVIYKEIPTIDVKSNECEDIKKMLDSIKESGL